MGLSDYTETGGPPLTSHYQSCSGWGLQGFSVSRGPVSSYLAFPSLPHCCGGIFLLHFPWSRLHRVLPGALPCGARTFLTPKRAAIQSAQIFNPPPHKESCRNFHILQYCLLLSDFGELLTEAAFCNLRNGLPPILP